MKFLKICIVALLIIPINSLFSQTNSNRKVTEDRTRNWQYESKCFESGGAGSSYLIQVTSYVGDVRLALNQAKKNIGCAGGFNLICYIAFEYLGLEKIIIGQEDTIVEEKEMEE